MTWGLGPRLYAVARYRGLVYILNVAILGLAPQALCCRPLRGLDAHVNEMTWGLRPRLYAVARFAGFLIA